MLDVRPGLRRGFLDHVAEQTAAAHADALAEDPTVDALVFLPGVAEVEAVAERLRARVPGHDVLTLHGRQEPAEQDAAIAGRRVADEDLAHAVALIRRTHAVDDTLARARHYGQRAIDAIGPFAGGAAKAAMVEAVEFAIARAY